MVAKVEDTSCRAQMGGGGGTQLLNGNPLPNDHTELKR